MIPARVAALLVAGGGWHGLWLLAGRADGVGLGTTLALAAALGWALVRATHAVPERDVALLLAGSALASLSSTALIEIEVVVAGLYRCADARPRWPVLALTLLAVPVLPTLDVLVAWPLRRASALATAGLLRMNGVEVGLEGVALEWHGQRLLFDGPCSGVRMLWALLVLASLAGAVERASPLRFAGLLAVATAVALAGNALRAASLFYVEAGFVAVPGGHAMHEAVGLAAFTVAAAAAVPLLSRRRGVA
ncbi:MULTISPECIES: archaeosortase/exosortase family protein [Sphingomonas]|uniref:archaeosortase/exosortase family protein n=1 Tax=Sphingomonas TaxID=13687 RepID=UPI000DD7A07D|nr:MULTISPECIES: archaeosortase/exosortase family protein [Sphingomonas]